MHEGVPPGGPCIPELLVATNRVAGRADVAPAIEHWGPITLRGQGWVATPEECVEVDGEKLLRPRFRIGYLALDVSPSPLHPAGFDPGGIVRVVLGPDLPGASLAGTFRIATLGNRVGIRLKEAGAVMVESSRRTIASAPMVQGAIQVTPSGELIVMGPDHPTTGGYPVAGVVCSVDLGRLFARHPGAEVAFGDVTAATARQLARSRVPEGPYFSVPT